MKNSKLKKLLLVLLLPLLAFWGYVEIVNTHSGTMTAKQKIIKAIYPLVSWIARSGKKNIDEISKERVKPPVSIYSLKSESINGAAFDFNLLKGKKILVVNTASDCGFTPQYSELQKLYDQYHERLTIVAFPANDFKEQEKGSNEEIAGFCQKNYGISFPLMKKSIVVKTGAQNNIFKWLTDSTQNGWNSKAPGWNFTKYLISETGELINYFGAAVSPLSDEVVNAIKK